MLFNTRKFSFEGTIDDLKELSEFNKKLNGQAPLVKPVEKLPEQQVPVKEPVAEPVPVKEQPEQPKALEQNQIEVRGVAGMKITKIFSGSIPEFTEKFCAKPEQQVPVKEQPVEKLVKKKSKGKKKVEKPISQQEPQGLPPEMLKDGEFAVSTQWLGKGLARISRIAPKKSSRILPILQNVRIDPFEGRAIVLTVTSDDCHTTGQIEICAAVKGDFSPICVNFHYLNDIVKKVKADYLVFRVDGTNLRISGGEASFILRIEDVDNFPEVFSRFPVEEKFDVDIVQPALGFLKNLKKVSYAMAREDVRWYLNGIYVEVDKDSPLMLTATDGHRLAYLEIERGYPSICSETSVLWENSGVKILERMLTFAGETSSVRITYSIHEDVDHGVAVFQCDDWKLSIDCVNFSAASNRYPDYQQVIPMIGVGDILTWKLSLEERTNLVTALNAVRGTANGKFNGTKLNFADGNLTISAASSKENEPQFASSAVVLKTHVSGEREIGFRINYLLDALEGMRDEEEITLQLTDCYSSVLFYRKGYSAVVMPMRL